jgi:hypothetical protein
MRRGRIGGCDKGTCGIYWHNNLLKFFLENNMTGRICQNIPFTNAALWTILMGWAYRSKACKGGG